MSPRTPQPGQGPHWLADVLLTPPWWVKAFVIVLGLAVGLATAWRLARRSWKVSTAHQSLMLEIAAVIVGVVAVVGVLRTYAGFSYWVDVGIGAAIGWGLPTTGFALYRRLIGAFETSTDFLRGWTAVLVGAIGLSLAGIVGPVTRLAQAYLVLLAAVMLTYNIQATERDHNEAETA